MVRREAQRLDDIEEAIRDIETFTAGMDARAYALNTLIKGAVASKLVVIGEAIKNLPPDLRGRHPAVDWAKWAGLRDVLVHQYFRIDQRRIWRVIERDVPQLKAAVDVELKRIAPGA